MVILIAKVDAVVPRGEHLHARPKLGGEVELSGAEHLAVEVEEAAAAGEKRLQPVGVKEIDLCADGTPASTVGINAPALRPRLPHHRHWDYFGNIAQCNQTIREDQTAVSGLDLVHATINSAAEGMAIPELPLEPNPKFIIVCGPLLGTSKVEKKRRCKEYAQKPRPCSG